LDYCGHGELNEGGPAGHGDSGDSGVGTARLGIAAELSTQGANVYELHVQRGTRQAAVRAADPQEDEARAYVTVDNARQETRARCDTKVMVAAGGRPTRVQPRRVNGTSAGRGDGWRVARPRYRAKRRRGRAVRTHAQCACMRWQAAEASVVIVVSVGLSEIGDEHDF